MHFRFSLVFTWAKSTSIIINSKLQWEVWIVNQATWWLSRVRGANISHKLGVNLCQVYLSKLNIPAENRPTTRFFPQGNWETKLNSSSLKATSFSTIARINPL